MRPNPAVALLLAVILALAGVAAGAARGQADPAGTVVLCTGEGAVTVHVDADGRPVDVPHRCPDCTLAAAALPTAPSVAPGPATVTRLSGLSQRADRHIARPSRFRARAPPRRL